MPNEVQKVKVDFTLRGFFIKANRRQAKYKNVDISPI